MIILFRTCVLGLLCKSLIVSKTGNYDLKAQESSVNLDQCLGKKGRFCFCHLLGFGHWEGTLLRRDVGASPGQRPVIAPKINLGVKKVHAWFLNILLNFLALLGCRIISFYYCIITEVFVTAVSCDMSEISTSNERRLLHVRKRKVGPSINCEKLTNKGKKDFWIALIYIV